MIAPFQEIIALLDSKKIHYEVCEHEPVYTSEQAARVRGLTLQQGAKSLPLKAKNDYVVAVMPGNKKLSSKKLKQKLGVKDLRLATPDEVKEKMGCEIGACYLFGNVPGLRTIVDFSLSKTAVISFNPGLHDKSIKMKWSDYRQVVSPEMADISE